MGAHDLFLRLEAVVNYLNVRMNSFKLFGTNVHTEMQKYVRRTQDIHELNIL